MGAFIYGGIDMDKIKQNTDQRPFTMVYNDCLESELFDNIYQLTLYITLKRFADSNNQCFPSHKTLAKISRMSITRVKITLTELIKKGIIEKINRTKPNGGKTSNLYIIHDYKSMWTATNSDDVKRIIEQQKKQEAIELLRSLGYTITDVEGAPVELEEKSVLNVEDIPSEPEEKSVSNVKDVPSELKNQPKETYSLEWIKSYFCYNTMIEKYPNDQDKIDSVFNILHTTINTTSGNIRIKGDKKALSVVKNKLLKLKDEDIIYAIGKFLERTDKITNTTAYMITLLYNAPEQRHLEMANLAQHNKAQKNGQPIESPEIVGSIPINQQQSVTQKSYDQNKPKNKFHQFHQREVTQEELDKLEHELLNR